MTVLVVNAGSSTLKYALVGRDGALRATGLIDRIGEDADGEARHTANGATHRGSVRTADHDTALEQMLAAFARHGPELEPGTLDAVGHRVVHGGDRFTQAVVVDDAVVDAVAALTPLAPLHNPANLAGIRAARRAFPEVPQVAAFDTAFHHTLPARAATYAVPRAWREELGVRRYGFHGISHQDASRRAWQRLGRPARSAVVVLHLGNGASACAVRDGISVDTSMGMTPLEGLVMGTRPGDLDPGVVAHVSRATGVTCAQVDDALAHDSGLRALAGVSDFRAVQARADDGDPDARRALDVFAYRVVKYVGAYTAVMGGLDAIVFTGGIGAGGVDLRRRVCDQLAGLGVQLDPAANRDAAAHGERVSSTSSPVAVFAFEAREEQAIAAMCRELLDGPDPVPVAASGPDGAAGR